MDATISAEARVPALADPETPEGGAKRRQIMEGAWAVFLAAGFDGASMNDVARVAGVSKGTLYVYFDSKEKLFEALIREERSRQAERLAVPFAPDEGDPRTVLSDFGCRLIEMMIRPEHLAHVRTVIAAAAKFPQLGRAFFEAGPAYGAQRLAGYFRRKTEEGMFAIDDPDRAAWQFLELIQGGKFKALMFRMMDEIAPEEIAETVQAGVDVFLKAYGRKGAGGELANAE
ncbi:MAG TPA: TetR/AcrR family transcriptional regulator [Roseiarcus sp.]|nr:TetR/AcrR family transcriptional regulator [Roseiarcus sp.]